jgi:uncharacterized Ntn-hydrolase superfamily protein
VTYSIVARDPATGELGVAVQTCNLAVGTWVPWAEAGIGAVATQAAAERSYGTLGLSLLRGHKSAGDALAALLTVDPRREFRQVAMVDARGQPAAHTGTRCLPAAGHFVGDGFATQANMMARSTVWGAMAEAYQGADGDLADRLLASLDAAEAEGGDIRGRQTAALLVVGPHGPAFPLVDLRVDHDPQPLAELRRLLALHRAYAAERAVPAQLDAGNIAAATESLNKIGEWAPDEAYLQYLRAVHLAGRLDRWDEALAILRPLVAQKPIWREYLRREADVGHFGNPDLGKRLLTLLEIGAT